MKPLVLLALLGGLLAAGCGAQEATATKKEEENFQNPSKTPPPGASNMGGPPKGARTGP